ncbi:hypothetical protein Bca52824_062451 [Brassica carinata]|uniref:Uncharacterized protein n=1 Tax=Brassica carinata TaxID=52824 RepID=A0A8X7QCR4_BRACI|nr:hypothetical protein Bca52824_062451 [Brassica carinata]
MGRYSYSQPSSSEEYDIDITSLLQAEADLYADEAESSQNIIEAVQYPPQSESDDGIPKTCYCGAEAVVATAYTSKDPGRSVVFLICMVVMLFNWVEEKDNVLTESLEELQRMKIRLSEL